ncbi:MULTISPECIES: LexA family transcriptional regulator [unclassified Neisseria]|uniref:LexA family transcriptional regulator n=1 Tax=unclassified Neisseria TaxID=2623750 RepID=UPI0026664C98|nr:MULTISPECIES: LexA family transcriptional regulator [unclassified Neisseria]MDO1510904.1 LexA family transcriptional regulator [Neisseria sp. MVDL19-042950]MDO1517194.1 LexA family transcriptional regulator [Neisseria sp. MVDL18-041461]MDO1564537.1 LexA family transcriptional regulator [Neisseria sp. MVDL20-010259]
MTLTILDRAKISINAKTDLALAKFLGVNASTIAGYKQRETVPLEQCIKISELTGVSLDWLVLGKGEKDEHQYSTSSDTILIPLYSTLAGTEDDAFFDYANIIRHVPFDATWLKREGLKPQNLVCLPIKGNSMIPSLIDGDIILIDRARQHGDGVFVLRIGNELRIKRIQWLANGSLRISSDNPLYQPEILSPTELDNTQFSIIGMCHTKIGRVV